MREGLAGQGAQGDGGDAGGGDDGGGDEIGGGGGSSTRIPQATQDPASMAVL